MKEYHLEFKLAKYRQEDGFVVIHRAKDKEKVNIEELATYYTDRFSKQFKTPVKYIKYTEVSILDPEVKS